MDISTFLSQLAEHCGVEASEVSISQEEDDQSVRITLQVPENESGRFIGHHGDSLEAIQRIARLVFQEEYQEKRLVVNINTYREDRANRLREIVQSVVERVKQSGESHTFHSYLPANERFIVHTAVSEMDPEGEVESVSVGEGRDRRLSIQLKASEDRK